MLSPSDFNNAVPQFTNGNYASNPINPQYIAEPDAESYNRGTEPLQTLPAQWWNWFLNKFTARFNKVNIYVKNIFNELAQVLSIFNITPDGTEQTPTTSQLKTVFESCYPQYVKTAACLVGTETTVNGHPLSSNVTVTRSDLGLGTSATVNTGTGVGCIPTVGTALGTTNNNILVTDSTGKLKPSGTTVGTAAGCDATFFAKKTELNALYGNTVGTALGTAAVGTCTTFARSDHVHPVTGLVTTCVDSANCPGIGAAGNYSTFIRTTECGLIPYCIDATNGYGYLGVNGWPFKEVHSINFYGKFNGAASSAYTVARTPWTANYNFHLALFNACTSTPGTDLFVSAGCPITYNSGTGVLSASSFSGAVTGTIWASQRTFSCAAEAEVQLLEVLSDNYGYVSRLRMGLTPNQPGFRSGFLAIGCNDQGTAFDRFYFVQGHGGQVITSTTIGSQTVACATSATCASVLVACSGAGNEYFRFSSFFNVEVRKCSSSFTIVQRDPDVVALQCDLWKAFTYVASTSCDMNGPRPISTFGQIRFGTCYDTNRFEDVRCIYPLGSSWIIVTDVCQYTITQGNTGGFAGINIEGRIADSFPWRP